MRLFIADDSEILRERLVEIISEIEGVEIVGQEGDAIKAIEAIKRLHPDLVILDIQMPGGNGISILETLKKMENPPKVIMFTNYPYLQYRRRCLEAGADFFFYKATEFEKLVDVIRKLAKTHRQKKETNTQVI
jgi:DNA-binding NarL/FixJ family response regulator